MKKYLFLFVTAVSLALFSGRAHAQRYLPGMKGVELRGGFANGSKSPLNYYTGFAVSGYTPKANRWVIGAEYLMKNYGYRDASVPRAQFTAEGGYSLTIRRPEQFLDRTVDIRWERSVGLPRQNIARLTLERLADARQGIKADAFDFT